MSDSFLICLFRNAVQTLQMLLPCKQSMWKECQHPSNLIHGLTEYLSRQPGMSQILSDTGGHSVRNPSGKMGEFFDRLLGIILEISNSDAIGTKILFTRISAHLNFKDFNSFLENVKLFGGVKIKPDPSIKPDPWFN